MRLFDKLFKFPEESYSETQKALLGIAKFQPSPLVVPAVVDSINAPETTAELTIYRERCDFAINTKCATSEKCTKSISAGIFWMPSVGELRRLVQDAARSIETNDDPLATRHTVFKNIVGESRSMHSKDIQNGDIVQAASQFNTLEFPTPTSIPEEGIEQYVYDHTQGPACALACFAGTAYRNYLVPVSTFDGTSNSCDAEIRGQIMDTQLNGLDQVEEYVQSQFSFSAYPWKVRNGYVEISSKSDLERLNAAIVQSDDAPLRDELVSRVRIGIHDDTEVTDILVGENSRKASGESIDERKFVTQTFNSAISIGYSSFPRSLWRPMARLVLDATYEATLLVGALKTIRKIQKQQEKENGTRKVATRPTIFLTKVGGGVFRNKDDWIIEAIGEAVERVETMSGVGLDIRLVHFGQIDSRYLDLEQRQE